MYLASPYTALDAELKRRRVRQTMEALASLHAQNIVAYSPIVHWYEVVKEFALPDDHLPWIVQCEGMMRLCGSIGILRLDGWRESRGVKHEIDFSMRNGLSIFAFDLVGSMCVHQGLMDVSELPELA